MVITRQYLQNRIQELTNAKLEQDKVARDATILSHTLNGAIQNTKHSLAEFDKPVGMGPELVKTDVTMEAEVNAEKAG